MLKWTVKVLFIYFSFFINSAILGVVNITSLGSAPCRLSSSLVNEIASYRKIVNKIIDEITNGRFKGKTYDALAELSDLYGPRMTCSSNLESAINYVVEDMKKNGLENVHTENVSVSNWARGNGYLELQKPQKKNIRMLSLGTSVGTAKGGITADVVVYESFEEFNKVSDDVVKGKIVLFVPQWEGYKKTVIYRERAASVASRKGAVAAMVRAITPFSLDTLHAGSQTYEEGVKKIPAVTITVEDAHMLLRMFKRGQQINAKLEIDDGNKPNCTSNNVIAEFEGALDVDKHVIVVSGHFDTWDVGVGAMDDGGGSVISWKAVEFLKAMNIRRPSRTIRAILWTGGEQGSAGAKAYMDSHRSKDKEEFNFLMESDSGTFEPYGLDYTGLSSGACILKEVLKLMEPLNATELLKSDLNGGDDISWWAHRGFPVSSLLNKNERYYWYQHTNADNLNVWENKDILDRCTALWAAVSYVVASISPNMPKIRIQD